MEAQKAKQFVDGMLRVLPCLRLPPELGVDSVVAGLESDGRTKRGLELLSGKLERPVGRRHRRRREQQDEAGGGDRLA